MMKQITKGFVFLLVAAASLTVSVNAFTPLQRRSSNASPVAILSQSTIVQNNNKVRTLLQLNEDSQTQLDHDQHQQQKTKNPEPVLAKLLRSTTSTATTATTTASAKSSIQENASKMILAALMFALTMMPLPSDAAMSGGRMGGSYASPSRSRVAPMSRSYSSPVRSGGTSSYGYSTRPRVTIAPTLGFGYGAGYGYGYGGGYSPFMTPYFGGGGPGIISYSRGPSFFDLFLLGGFLFAVTTFFKDAGNNAIASSSDWSSSALTSSSSSSASALGPGVSVAQITVAMEVPDRDDPNSILSALNRISQTARTNSKVGIQNLTSQVALELLRRKSSIVSATTSSQHYRDSTKATRDYQTKAIRERSKFEQETNSQYGGVDYSSSSSLSNRGGGGTANADASGKATMAVVTLLLEIQGDSTQLPKANSMTNVEEALRKIASDSKVSDCLQSVEILWTPEDRSEILTRREVIADYPELRSV